jgi:dipeptidyl aminopeptidase/acylaminoacyl peptidase
MSVLGRRLVLPALVILAALIAAAPALATFPGKNGRIGFLSEAMGGPPPQNWVSTVNDDGTDLRYLIPGHDVAWSADGGRLAFENFGRIYVMDADGRNLRRVGPDEPIGVSPNWSPDGDKLVVDGFEGVEVIDISSGRRSLIVSGRFTTNPTWAPDGSVIGFSRIPDREIYVVKPDGTGLQNVTNSPQEESFVDWSPDSRRIAFATSPSFIGGLCVHGAYTMRRDGTDRTTVWEANCSPQPLPNRGMTYKPSGELVFPGWDLKSWQPVPLVTTPDGPINEFFEANWQPLPEPRRVAFKNAPAYCSALRAYLGEPGFAGRYRNHGACVSQNH